MAPRVMMTIRVSEEFHQKLVKEAGAKSSSTNGMVVRILETHFDRQEIVDDLTARLCERARLGEFVCATESNTGYQRIDEDRFVS
ncbi:MAG: hypothetical protein JWL62_3331 [Hyphomicrobiales bacterium]|nr:hypothetical protein [Hyphomicrobiales bacterium]